MTVLRTKAQFVANYRVQLAENFDCAVDGLMTVFNNQVEDEVATESTHWQNRIGFNKSDAKMLTQLAKNRLDGKDLDADQRSEVMRRMPKYAWQIVTSKIRNGHYAKRDGIYVKV